MNWITENKINYIMKNCIKEKFRDKLKEWVIKENGIVTNIITDEDIIDRDLLNKYLQSNV